MSRFAINIVTLVYLSLVVTLIFSVNEIPVISDMNTKEKAVKIVKNTLRRIGKLLGALILIGIIVQILGSLG